MAIWFELKRRLKDVVGPVLGICVVGYFVYHSIEGERGILSLLRLSEEVQQARLNYDDLKREREALERRAGLLRSDHLDPDLLEERARAILNYVRPDEIVILDHDEAPKAKP